MNFRAISLNKFEKLLHFHFAKLVRIQTYDCCFLCKLSSLFSSNVMTFEKEKLFEMTIEAIMLWWFEGVV